MDRPWNYGSSMYMEDENVARKNTTRTIEVSDNGKLLRCVASHIALDRPLEETQKIIVHCKY